MSSAEYANQRVQSSCKKQRVEACTYFLKLVFIPTPCRANPRRALPVISKPWRSKSFQCRAPTHKVSFQIIPMSCPPSQSPPISLQGRAIYFITITPAGKSMKIITPASAARHTLAVSGVLPTIDTDEVLRFFPRCSKICYMPPKSPMVSNFTDSQDFCGSVPTRLQNDPPPHCTPNDYAAFPDPSIRPHRFTTFYIPVSSLQEIAWIRKLV